MTIDRSFRWALIATLGVGVAACGDSENEGTGGGGSGGTGASGGSTSCDDSFAPCVPAGGCLVQGEVYEDGDTVPGECADCTCNDGELLCDAIDCEATCDSYDNAASSGQMTIRFVNQRAEPLYLDEGACSLVPYDITGPDGVVKYQGDSCFPRCQELRESDVYSCAGACAEQPVVVVEPGGFIEFSWQLLHYAYTEMPEFCYGPDVEVQSCGQWQSAAAGNYDISGRGFADVTCAPDDPGCGCTFGPDGTCEIDGALGSGTPLVGEVTVSVPEDALAEVVFVDP